MTKIKEKTNNIDNFIGIYDNYIPEEECKKVIQFFENQNKFKKTFDRISTENSSVLEKKDRHYVAGAENVNLWWPQFKTLIANFEIAWRNYVKNTGAEEAYKTPFHFTMFKNSKNFTYRRISCLAY